MGTVGGTREAPSPINAKLLFKELDLTEGRGTGVPKILRAMRENGSPPPEFRFDEDHSYFAMVLRSILTTTAESR